MNSTAQTTLALMSEKTGDRTAWVHLLPSGTFTGRDGRGPYKLDDASKVLAASRAYFGKGQMVIDYDHQTVFSAVPGVGGTAPAAGWIVGLEARENGIWGLVEWTEAAAARIAKREYRYLSPVYRHTAGGSVTRIISAGLTNVPNLELTAISRAEGTMNDENAKRTPKLIAAAEILGLPDGSDQATILARVKAIVAIAAELANETGDGSLAPQSANPDPAKFVPIGDFERVVADANKLRQGVTESVAVNRVADDVRSGKLAPFMKEWAVSLCTVNMPAYDSFMNRVGPAFTGILAAQRAGSKLPTDPKAGDLSDDELAVAARMGLSVEDYTKAR